MRVPARKLLMSKTFLSVVGVYVGLLLIVLSMSPLYTPTGGLEPPIVAGTVFLVFGTFKLYDLSLESEFDDGEMVR